MVTIAEVIFAQCLSVRISLSFIDTSSSSAVNFSFSSLNFSDGIFVGPLIDPARRWSNVRRKTSRFAFHLAVGTLLPRRSRRLSSFEASLIRPA